ncbi:hypothetical protein D3C76_1076760 [compost metagenome]
MKWRKQVYQPVHAEVTTVGACEQHQYDRANLRSCFVQIRDRFCSSWRVAQILQIPKGNLEQQWSHHVSIPVALVIQDGRGTFQQYKQVIEIVANVICVQHV